MKELNLHEKEAGQTLYKYLKKYLPLAPDSFLHKMLRKKNITLNGKKADGTEKTKEGDVIKLFFSEETLTKFTQADTAKETDYIQIYQKQKDSISVLWENKHVIFLNKPAGVLSQKADAKDWSMNEYLIGYLLAKQEISNELLQTFRPAICNRLDRNTTGIIIGGKTIFGLQQMNQLLKDHSLHKYYRCFVSGKVEHPGRLEGYLTKDHLDNKVNVQQQNNPDSDFIQTAYQPLQVFANATYLEVELITGKTHQIRAHLASIGHPILGDSKYGKKDVNTLCYKKYGIKHQLLHAYRLAFPTDNEALLDALNGQVLCASLPTIYEKLLQEGVKFK